jgi:hypothetical protein
MIYVARNECVGIRYGLQAPIEVLLNCSKTDGYSVPYSCEPVPAAFVYAPGHPPDDRALFYLYLEI